MKAARFAVCVSVALAVLVAGCATSQTGSTAQPQQAEVKPAGERLQPREKWSRVRIQASVEKIDRKKRKITLKGPQGQLVTLTATDQIKRFDEIEVGDSVQSEYWTFLRAEFREPTAEEKAAPLVVLAEAGRAPKEVDPAGAVGAVVKAVVTVIAINREDAEVIIQGPRGNYVVLPVVDEEVLKKLEVGEVVIMTYAEAVALSLRKKR